MVGVAQLVKAPRPINYGDYGVMAAQHAVAVLERVQIPLVSQKYWAGRLRARDPSIAQLKIAKKAVF